MKSNHLTDDMLRQIMPNAPRIKRLASLPILNKVMEDYDINNERRVAAWLATLAIESGELKYQEEIASGAAYEGRIDLGNTQPGDGKRFKGHGRIQITGRANHTSYTHYLKGSGHLPFIDFIANPQRLAEEPYATDSAGWFWAVLHDLNSLADKRNFLKTQIKVNGMNRKTRLPNHWTERKAFYERGLRVLPDDFLLEGAEVVEDDTSADIDEVSLSELTQEMPPNPGKDLPDLDLDKGVTTSPGKSKEDTAGSPPPTPAVEIKASQVSWADRLSSLTLPAGIGGAVMAVVKAFATIPPWVWAIVIPVAIIATVYLWNRKEERAHQRTMKLMAAGAAQDQNNLRLVDEFTSSGSN